MFILGTATEVPYCKKQTLKAHTIIDLHVRIIIVSYRHVQKTTVYV